MIPAMCGEQDMAAGERDLRALACQAQLLQPDEPMPKGLLEFALLIVHACAQIGDGYWRDDASAGQHIRAIYYP